MRLFFLWIVVVLLLQIPTVFAGQGFIINEEGTPPLWDASSSSPIAVHLDSGACGQFSNSDVQSRFASAVAEWTDLEFVDLGFSLDATTLGGIDGCNYGTYLASVEGSVDSDAANNDGYNPIVFDNDAEITRLATGETNYLFILGFATITGYSADDSNPDLATGIGAAHAVFNCYCVETADGDYNNSECETNDIKIGSTLQFYTMVHEMGHFLNLDHSLNNDDLASSDYAVMYPFVDLDDPPTQTEPTEDDAVALASLYPATGFFTEGDSSSAYCKVTGTLLDHEDFDNELRCADVRATTSDVSLNVDTTSGAYAVNTDANDDGDTQDSGECTDGCGDFVLYLQPGVSYTLSVASLDSSAVGGGGIGPCRSSQLSACTTTIVNRCTSNLSCTACINDETLTANNASNNIATLISTGCTAGAVVNLGDITTGSISSTSADTVNGSVSASPALTAVLSDDDLFSRVLSASSDSVYQSASCPESGGSSTSDSSSTSCGLSCRLSREEVGFSQFMAFPTLFLVSLVFIIIWRFRKKSSC